MAWLLACVVVVAILLTAPLGPLVSLGLYRFLPNEVLQTYTLPSEVRALSASSVGVFAALQNDQLAMVEAGVRGAEGTHPLVVVDERCEHVAVGSTRGVCARGSELLTIGLDGQQSHRFQLEQPIRAVASFREQIAVVTEDEVLLFDAAEPTPRRRLRLEMGPVGALAILEGVALIGAGSELVVVSLIAPEGPEEMLRLDYPAAIRSIACFGGEVYIAHGDRVEVRRFTGARDTHVMTQLGFERTVQRVNVANGNVVYAVLEGGDALPMYTPRALWWWVGSARGVELGATGVAGARDPWFVHGRTLTLAHLWGSKRFAVVFVGVVAAVSGLVLLMVTIYRRRDRALRATVWSLVCLGLLVGLLSSRLGTPIETLHILEYSTLGFLVYRALQLAGWAGLGTGLVSLIIAVTAGFLDETVQSTIPYRTGSLEDIGLDLRAVGIGVLFAWQVVYWGLPARRDPLPLAPVLAVPLVLWTAFFYQFETGFGGRYEAGDGLSYFSRLTPDEIAEADSARKHEVAATLLEEAPFGYSAFLTSHPASVDPFVHELRVHLFRRDRRLEKGDIAVACAEDELIQRLYPETVPLSGFAWSGALRATCPPRTDAYESPVSGDIATAFRPGVMWGLAGVLSGLLIAMALGLWLRRRGMPPLSAASEGE